MDIVWEMMGIFMIMVYVLKTKIGMNIEVENIIYIGVEESKLTWISWIMWVDYAWCVYGDECGFCSIIVCIDSLISKISMATNFEGIIGWSTSFIFFILWLGHSSMHCLLHWCCKASSSMDLIFDFYSFSMATFSDDEGTIFVNLDPI